MLRNFLWVPLTAHAKALGYKTSFLAPIFVENVGARFLPNLLVTQVGAKTELPMMFCVLCGYDPKWARCGAAESPVLRIAGAEGQFGENWTNGIYDVEVIHPEMPPVYVLRSGPYERFLYLDAERPPESLRHSLRASGLGFRV
ncbi:unnamed protein product [Symbiodinium microadriaticum]|nr:unnamed protein product [Symbiodinium microadriaticum]